MTHAQLGSRRQWKNSGRSWLCSHSEFHFISCHIPMFSFHCGTWTLHLHRKLSSWPSSVVDMVMGTSLFLPLAMEVVWMTTVITMVMPTQSIQSPLVGGRLRMCTLLLWSLLLIFRLPTLSSGAVDEKNRMPWYAELCPCMLAVTYSNGDGDRTIVTTDVSVHKGCTKRFTGTSAAAPIASGTIALMLQVR